MSQLFADTFYFLALLHEKEEAHRRAVELTARQQFRILTTAWVLTELADYLCSARNRQRFGSVYQSLQIELGSTIVSPDAEIFEKALNLCFQRPDKSWSLTDCTSFIAMQKYGIAEALTADHHFEQAGFTALLK